MDAPALDAGTVGLPGDPRQAVVAVALDGDGDRFGRTDPGVVDDTPVYHTQGVERRLARRCSTARSAARRARAPVRREVRPVACSVIVPGGGTVSFFAGPRGSATVDTATDLPVGRAAVMSIYLWYCSVCKKGL